MLFVIVVLAVSVGVTAFARARLPRSPLRSVDEFRHTMRALAPRRNDGA